MYTQEYNIGEDFIEFNRVIKRYREARSGKLPQAEDEIVADARTISDIVET